MAKKTITIGPVTLGVKTPQGKVASVGGVTIGWKSTAAPAPRLTPGAASPFPGKYVKTKKAGGSTPPKGMTRAQALKVRGQRQKSGVAKGYHISKAGNVVMNKGKQKH